MEVIFETFENHMIFQKLKLQKICSIIKSPSQHAIFEIYYGEIFQFSLIVQYLNIKKYIKLFGCAANDFKVQI